MCKLSLFSICPMSWKTFKNIISKLVEEHISTHFWKLRIRPDVIMQDHFFCIFALCLKACHVFWSVSGIQCARFKKINNESKFHKKTVMFLFLFSSLCVTFSTFSHMQVTWRQIGFMSGPWPCLEVSVLTSCPHRSAHECISLIPLHLIK